VKRRKILAGAVAVLALSVTACGGGGGGSSSSGAGTSGGGAATTGADSGQKLFASLGCKSCHTLKAADARGQVGPNLDTLKPSEAAIVKQVTDGGGAMPAFKDQVSGAEIQAIAKYVHDVAGQ
jgi:mono/diheme cytochrome c family protein